MTIPAMAVQLHRSLGNIESGDKNELSADNQGRCAKEQTADQVPNPLVGERCQKSGLRA